jgi:hypothetical protein
VVDSRRVGLTGFSDAAATAQFSMLNSDVFSAVAISNCCDDSVGNMTLLGPQMARSAHAMGYPRLNEDGSAFWAGYSLTANARSARTPLLIQIPDSEYLIALPSYTALVEQHKPVEMRVFPDETHVRWQPAHPRANAFRKKTPSTGWVQLSISKPVGNREKCATPATGLMRPGRDCHCDSNFSRFWQLFELRSLTRSA